MNPSTEVKCSVRAIADRRSPPPDSEKASIALSILIPTHNGIRHLEQCLASVCRHAPRNTQILVVDDGSSDNTSAWLAEQYPHVEVLTLSASRGFVGAVNAGLQRVRGDIVELLNNDTEVCPGWAEKCLPHFDDPSVGSVAPLVLRMADPGIIDSAGQSYHICGWATDRGYGRPLTDEFLTPCEVFGPCASAGFYRREALTRVGGLLPEFEAYLDDVDLSFRLRWAGYRCMYEPQARVHHHRSASYGQLPGERLVRLLSRNEELVWWNNMPADAMLLGVPAHAAYLTVRLLRCAASGRLGPFLRGKMQALAGVRQIRQRRQEVRNLQSEVQDLQLSRSIGVLRAGWTWLLSRQCY